MKTWAPSSTNRFAVANPIPSVPPVMTAVLPSSFLVTVSFSVMAERELSNSDASRSLTLEGEHRLAEVVGQVVRAAQQDREAISRSIFREIFLRNGRVPQDPVVPRHLFEPRPQFGIHDTPCTANLFVRRNVGSRPVGIRDKGDIELRMKSFSQREQRQHGVVDGCQMSPQVKHSIPARRNFPKDLLGRERSKKLVRPIDLGLPCFQPESCERRVVSHASISCQLMGVEPLTNIREARSSSRAPSTIPRCPTRFWRRRQRHSDGAEVPMSDNVYGATMIAVASAARPRRPSQRIAASTFGFRPRIRKRSRKRALEEGLPYQTLIASLLLKYASGRLREP